MLQDHFSDRRDRMSGYTAMMIARAEQAIADDRKEEAYAIIKPIVDVEPTNAEAWRVLADATDDPQEAIIARAQEAQARPINVQPNPPFVASYGEVAPSYSPSRHPLQGGLVICGATLMAIGALLPWASIGTGVFKQTIMGINAHGITVLISAVILLLAGVSIVIKDTKMARIGSLISLFVGAGFAINEMMDIMRVKSQRTELAVGDSFVSLPTEISMGSGLFFILIGVLIAFIGVCIPNKK